jgi:NAD(P)-dependent dehydrogenase (short-subunit alcohol dehydrogenase family)
MTFQDKVIIITGGSNGIGRELVKGYANLGAKVVIADIDETQGRLLAQEINEEGKSALFCQTDVRDPKQIEALMNQAVSHFGTIHILINNAGISVWKSPYELTVEEWDNIIHTNLRSAFLCAREAAKVMRKNGRGKIVNMASTRAFMSEIHTEAYAASKGGIVALTHALAASFQDDHIQVNCISPGWIETGDYSKLTEADHAQHFSKRVGRPNDIFQACVYLTQDGNEFINGQNITVDGGMTKKMIYVE